MRSLLRPASPSLHNWCAGSGQGRRGSGSCVTERYRSLEMGSGRIRCLFACSSREAGLETASNSTETHGVSRWPSRVRPLDERLVGVSRLDFQGAQHVLVERGCLVTARDPIVTWSSTRVDPTALDWARCSNYDRTASAATAISHPRARSRGSARSSARFARTASRTGSAASAPTAVGTSSPGRSGPRRNSSDTRPRPCA